MDPQDDQQQNGPRAKYSLGTFAPFRAGQPLSSLALDLAQRLRRAAWSRWGRHRRHRFSRRHCSRFPGHLPLLLLETSRVPFPVLAKAHLGFQFTDLSGGTISNGAPDSTPASIGTSGLRGRDGPLHFGELHIFF